VSKRTAWNSTRMRYIRISKNADRKLRENGRAISWAR
jgi:hypothetical protein